MTSISELTKNWEGAVVTLIDRNGLKMERAAVFVFDWPKGFAWLEPGYADPWGSPSPTWHEVEVTVDRVSSTIFYFEGPVWHGDVEEYFGQPSVEAAMTWYVNWLAEQGRSWDQERKRLIKQKIISKPVPKRRDRP